MRKFKHKQTGIIGEVKDDNHLHYTRKSEDVTSIESIPMIFIENSNDWEEVVEKDYEILSFKSNKDTSIMNRNDFGSFGFGVSLDKMLYGEQSVEDGRWEIYSVKRLSDGEIFTIGDSCYWESFNETKDIFKIHRFKIHKGDFYVYSEIVCECTLKGLIHAKKPTILTTDNVCLSTGECLWYYMIDEKYIRMTTLTETNLGLLSSKEIYVFSSRMAAETHLKLTIPKFSIQNIEDAYVWDKSAPLYQTFINNLKEAIGE